jgi:hypothetical protein
LFPVRPYVYLTICVKLHRVSNRAEVIRFWNGMPRLPGG